MSGQKRVGLSLVISAALGVAGTGTGGCGDAFSSNCYETHTCPPKTVPGPGGEAGGDGDAGRAGTNDAAGSGDGGAGGSDVNTAAGRSSSDGGAGGSPDCTANEQACGNECLALQVDPKNCGACGHDCLGGECILGTCQPFEFATVNGFAGTFAQDERFLYWGGGYGALGKRVRDGSAQAVELVPESANEIVQRLQVVGSTLYWSTDNTNNGVRGCTLPSCSDGPQTLVPGTTPSRGLAYDPQTKTLFWGDAKNVRRKTLPNGDVEDLTAVTDSVQALATDSVFIYVSDWSPVTRKAAVYRAGLNGGEPSKLVGNLVSVRGMVPYAKTLYVLDSFQSNDGGRVLAVPLPNGVGGNDAPIFATTADGTGLAVDESGVYWVTGGAEGSVSHCALSGCTEVVDVLAPTSFALGIATDATSIYWASRNKIMKLAK